LQVAPHVMSKKQEAQLLLRIADREASAHTSEAQRPTSNHREKAISER